MKLTSMRSRDRRALMLGAIVAVPGLLWPLVVKPYLHELSNVKEQTSKERDKLARDQRAIAELPTLPAVRARTSQQLDKELNRLFQSNDELVATGDMAQYVAGVAQDNGVRLQQSETRPAQPVVPGVQALQLQIHAEGDLDGVLHFLRQLESGGKLIRVGALSIDGGRGSLDAQNNTITSRVRSSGTDGGSVPDSSRTGGVEVLSLSASVYGYRLSGATWSSVNTRGKSAPSPFQRTPYDFESLDAILNHDPFSATRTRPSVSYRLAMLESAHPRPQKVMPQRLRQKPQLQLLGTAVGDNQTSFAVLQSSNATPKIKHIGEQIDGYTLVSVSRGGAVLADPDNGRLRLQTNQLTAPGSGQSVQSDGKPQADQTKSWDETRMSVTNAINSALQSMPPATQKVLQQRMGKKLFNLSDDAQKHIIRELQGVPQQDVLGKLDQLLQAVP